MNRSAPGAARIAALVLLDQALERQARRLSPSTIRIIRQNLIFAFIYDSLGVPISAGLLYPFFGILLSLVVANALLLRAIGL